VPHTALQYNIVAVENSTGHNGASVVVSVRLRVVVFSCDFVVVGKFVDEDVASFTVGSSFVCGSIWVVFVANNVGGCFAGVVLDGVVCGGAVIFKVVVVVASLGSVAVGEFS
jgi:hypothetical protein